VMSKIFRLTGHKEKDMPTLITQLIKSLQLADVQGLQHVCKRFFNVDKTNLNQMDSKKRWVQ
jgi:hypothetical protein